MFFQILKYLQPTNYFGLKKKDGFYVFPSINNDIASNFPVDDNYKTTLGQAYDQSWRAIQNGYINESNHIKKAEVLDRYEYYVFGRKYFNKAWVVYYFLMRILSLNHPVKEFRALINTRNVKRYKVGSELLQYHDYASFESPLLQQEPMISVIIPTLNRYTYLKDVLKDLEQQSYKNFEVIVIDQSHPFKEDFYSKFNLNLKFQYQEEKALWRARNTAIKQSLGNLVLLFDDDSRVEANWIEEHIKTLDFFNADISSGVSISKVGDAIPAHYSYFKISDQLDTGNVLLKKEVFNDIGLFDRQFEKQRMGDGEFGCRAFLSGLLNVSNPYAKRLHLKVGQGGLRDMGSWDAFRTKYLWQPRPIPSVLYYFRSYFGKTKSTLAIFKTVPLSVLPYHYKGNKIFTVIGVFVLLIIWPIILFQIFKSWYLSSKMIKEGPKIERL